MKFSSLFPAGAILAPCFALLASPAFANPSDTPPAGMVRADPWTRVLYDEPGDGRLWAVGASWKASFAPDGVVYFPRVGSSESRRLPHALSPELVTVGGEAIGFERAVQPVRSGDRVELDRGGFVERYDLAPGSVEQSFVFDALPGAGDLVLRIPVASELDAVATSAGLEFRSDHGRISYSRAVAVDANGRTIDAPTTIEDGVITIRVGEGALAHAAFPLVVDPVLNAIFPDLTQQDTFSLDAAYDTFNGVWVIAYERVFSSTDHDVIAEMYSSTGTFIAEALVDVTGDSWVRPSIAYLAFVHKFLVVAGSTTAGSGAKTVRGRVVQPNGVLLTQDLQVSISGALTGVCDDPDVGGDPTTDAPAAWCVVFHRSNAGVNTINYTLVTSSGTIALAPTPLPLPGGMSDANPSISKSNDASFWMITFERFLSLTQSIMFARVSPLGTLMTNPLALTSGTFFSDPVASSPIHGTNLCAIVWQGGTPVLPSGSSIAISLVDGATVLQQVDLMLIENSPFANEDQIEPSIDSDGSHFLVSYSEFDSAFSHYKMFATDLAVSGGTLQISQKHMELQPGLGQSQNRSSVAAARTTTGPLTHRYLVAYDYRQNDVDHDAAGRFVDGLAGGFTSQFCSGDVSLCPCGNAGLPGLGCTNSTTTEGGMLVPLGVPSTIADTLVLNASRMPAGSFCLFFQGTAVASPAAFGDGLLCTGGTLTRLGVVAVNALGGAVIPTGGGPSLTTLGGVPADGGLRTYQGWYRDAASFCTSATFNLTNGVSVQWAR